MKKKICIVIALLLGVQAGCRVESNLVSNPGFEQIEKGRPIGWEIDGRLTTLCTEEVHGGKFALKIADSSEKEGSSARSAPFTVEAGKSYTFSTWIYTLEGRGLGLYAEFYDANGKGINPSTGPLVKDVAGKVKRWQKKSFAVTAPSQARTGRVWLHSYSGAVVTAYVDDVSVMKGEFAPILEKQSVMKPYQEIPIKVTEGERPSVLIRKDEIPRMLKKVQEHEWAKKAYDALIKAADSWKNKTIEFPNRGGQWPHWYACSEDGARLKAQSPTEHKCPRCGKVYTGEPYDSVYITNVHNGLARAAQQLGLAFALTGEKSYAQKAREILLGYAERYEKYPLHDVRGGQGRSAARVLSQTLEEAVWLIPIAQAYDLVFSSDGADGSDMQKIETHLLRPAVELIRRNDAGISNWQSWHNAGMGAAALALRDKELLNHVINGKSGFQFQMANSVQDDGFWYEGAWGYHYYALTAHVALAEMALRSGMNLFENPRFRSMFDAPLRFMMPNTRLPAFHDSGEASALGPTGLYESAYAHWKDSNYAWVLGTRGRGGLEALLYGVPELPKVAAPIVESCNFAASGFGVLRTGADPNSLYLALDYGPHGGGHGHLDKLSFVFYGLGQTLAPDPGCVAYGLKVQSTWYHQTVAHNTIVVDEASQNQCAGKCTLFAVLPHMRLMEATADDAYDGVRMKRLVALSDDYVVIIDNVSSAEEHTYDWVYHNYGELTVDATVNQKAQAHPLGDGDGYEHVTSVKRGRCDVAWGATWRLADISVRLEMQGAPGTEVISGVGLGSLPAEKVPMIIARRKGKETTFCAVVQPYKNDKTKTFDLDKAISNAQKLAKQFSDERKRR